MRRFERVRLDTGSGEKFNDLKRCRGRKYCAVCELVRREFAACRRRPLPPALNPNRTIAELKELRALTGDENGAQRVAFTGLWAGAREWLRDKAGKHSRRDASRRSGESLGNAAGRIGKSAAHRRPHRFRAQRRLARWLPEHAGRSSKFFVAFMRNTTASRR